MKFNAKVNIIVQRMTEGEHPISVATMQDEAIGEGSNAEFAISDALSKMMYYNPEELRGKEKKK